MRDCCARILGVTGMLKEYCGLATSFQLGIFEQRVVLHTSTVGT